MGSAHRAMLRDWLLFGIVFLVGVAGDTSAGVLFTPDTAAGDTSAGDTSAGDISAGDTSAGDTYAGEDDDNDYDFTQDITGENDTVIGTQKHICEVCKCKEHQNEELFLDCSTLELNKVPESLQNVNENISIVVDFSYNEITIDLSHNEIRSIGKYLVSAISKDLILLNFKDNKINVTGLNEESFSTKLNEDPFSLKFLILSDNRIHSLPPALFSRLSNLEHLDLSSNPLVDLDMNTSTAIGTATSLQSLNLQECQLSYLPNTLLSGLTLLKTLDLSNNYFQVVDPSIKLASGITSLNIDSNDIQLLDHTSFEGLDKLQNLSVSEDLYFSRIEKDAFTPLINLKTLRMIKNPSLTWIHPEAWPINEDNVEVMFTLEELLLSENRLRYLPSMLLPTFSNWKEIKVLDIQGNPWWCDCHNEWMISTLVKLIYATTPHLTPNIICAGPPKTN